MRRLLRALGRAAAVALSGATAAHGKAFKIGAIFPETGPFAGSGSKANPIGTKQASAQINGRGGSRARRSCQLMPTRNPRSMSP